MMMKTKIQLTIVRWVVRHWFPTFAVEPCLAFVRQVDAWIRQRGAEWTIRRLKDLRLILWHHIAGTKYSVKYLAMRGDLPRIFDPWRDGILSRDITTLRLVNTLLNVSKVIRWWGTAKYDTIISPPSVSIEQIKSVGEELVEVMKSRTWPRLDTTCTNLHFSGASGPNGPALLSSLLEAALAPDSFVKDIGILGGEELASWMVRVREIINPIKDLICNKYGLRNNVLRRLALRLDFEGKIRPIGLFDYWSQAALKELHDGLFRLLRSFPADNTFDQGQFVRQVGLTQGPYYSFDLHAFTDRVPLLLQVMVLTVIIGKDKAEAWGRIMTQEPFLTPERTKVAYATGQPLGGYSSWAMCTLVHHLLVQLAAKMASKNLPFNGYWMLGDDLVIRDTEVASHYLELLATIGVEVSMEKSLVSKDTFEFAKRLFHKGVEVSGLSLNALEEARGRWIDLWAYLITLRERGWELPEARYGLVKELLVLMGSARSYATRAAFKIRVLESCRTVIQTYPNEDGVSHRLLQEMGHDVGCLRESFASKFLLECLAALKVQELQESLTTVTKEVNAFIQDFSSLVTPQVGLTQEDFQVLPPIAAFISKGQAMMGDKYTVEQLALSEDWIGLLRSTILLVPDPRRTITRKSSTDRARQAGSIASKLIRLVKDESRLRGQELSDA